MGYVLITSQYYHSRHCFICEYNEETFEQQGKQLIEELEKYKRESVDARNIHYGDLDPKWFNKCKGRWNVNDAGDIYFELYDSVNRCMHEALDYQEISRMQSRGYQKKIITESIAKHHDYETVKEIITSHFKIA